MCERLNSSSRRRRQRQLGCLELARRHRSRSLLYSIALHLGRGRRHCHDWRLDARDGSKMNEWHVAERWCGLLRNFSVINQAIFDFEYTVPVLRKDSIRKRGMTVHGKIFYNVVVLRMCALQVFEMLESAGMVQTPVHVIQYSATSPDNLGQRFRR